MVVGQDLLRLELGGPPKDGGEKKDAAPKQESKDESSDSKPKAAESKPEAESKQTSPEESKPAPKQESKPAPKQESSKASSQETPAKPSTDGSRDERRVSINSSSCLCLADPTLQVKMNRMRLRIAERLKQSQNTAASLTTFNEVDMSNIMEFRKLYKDETLKKTGVKLGFMSAFSRASVLAMRDLPAVNASIEGPNGGDTIVYRDYVDISVAVATEKGLVTPVVRNAESMSMIDVEKAIADMGKKVRYDVLSRHGMARTDKIWLGS